MKMLLMILATAVATPALGQGFIASIDDDDFSALFGRPAIVKLVSGDSLSGKMTGGTIINGYLSTIKFKTDSGETSKFKPEDVERLSIKAGKMAKLAMISEAGSSLNEMAKANFNEIVDREYIIFETARRSTKKGTPRLMQLLNPGFDGGIKVFADPNARKTMGLSIGGAKLLGGEDKSFLFVQGGEKAVVVKKGSYKENFAELYEKCPAMLGEFKGEKLKWNDVAGHVWVYDRICGSGTAPTG